MSEQKSAMEQLLKEVEILFDTISEQKISPDALRDKMKPLNKSDLDASVKLQAGVEHMEQFMPRLEAAETAVRQSLKGTKDSMHAYLGLQTKLREFVMGMESLVDLTLENSEIKSPTKSTLEIPAKMYAEFDEKLFSFLRRSLDNGPKSLYTLSNDAWRQVADRKSTPSTLRRRIVSYVRDSDEHLFSVEPYTIWKNSQVTAEFLNKGYVPLNKETYVLRKWTVDMKTNSPAKISLVEAMQNVIDENGAKIQISDRNERKITKSLPAYLEISFGLVYLFDAKEKNFRLIRTGKRYHD